MEVRKMKVVLEMVVCPVDGVLKTVDRCHDCDDLKEEDSRQIYCDNVLDRINW